MGRRLEQPSLFVLAAALGGCTHLSPAPDVRARAALERTPIFDGHNDLAIHFAGEKPQWSLERLSLERLPGQSNLGKFRAGGVGGALITSSSALEPGSPAHFESLQQSFDWFDSLVARHQQSVAKVSSLAELRQARRSGKIALMMAIEGGDQIDGSLDNLRTAYGRGVRSLGIVYNDHNAIGNGGMPDPTRARLPAGGLTPFGRAVIAEMNRLGMIVDLSHAAETTTTQAISASRAPVLFSHSAARVLTASPRNLSDPTLRLVARTGGVVMVPLVPYFVSEAYSRWWNKGEANYARLQGLYPDNAKRVAAESRQWDQQNPAPSVGISDVADHIEHVARTAGHDHVGIGSDFGGMGSHVIPQLADASMLPALFVELARRGWSQAQLEALAGGNFERLLADVERVRAR